MEKQFFGGACQCLCGHVKLYVQKPFMTRFFCHCTICQSVYQKPFADITVLLAKNVEIHDPNAILFSRHRLPPNVNRGICSSCKTPAIGFMRLVPGLKLAFLPTHMLLDQSCTPEAAEHLFYDSRIGDIDDALPKHSGYWSSELAAMRLIIPKLFTR